MGNFRDLFRSDHSWIQELVRGEIHPDADQLLQMGGHFDPQQLVEESTIHFLGQLREYFSEFAKIFNSFSEENAKFQEVKIYGVANTPADFMVYRNQLKLLFSNAAHGVIQISFSSHVRGSISVDGQPTSTAANSGGQLTQTAQELLAHVGPFRDISWTFHGEKVQPEQVSRFYFVEFARLTRDGRRARAGNQLLLDQIKALLQEKGLDL